MTSKKLEEKYKELIKERKALIIRIFNEDYANILESYNLLGKNIIGKDGSYLIIIEEIIINYTAKKYSPLNNNRGENTFLGDMIKILKQEGLIEIVDRKEITKEEIIEKKECEIKLKKLREKRAKEEAIKFENLKKRFYGI